MVVGMTTLLFFIPYRAKSGELRAMSLRIWISSQKRHFVSVSHSFPIMALHLQLYSSERCSIVGQRTTDYGQQTLLEVDFRLLTVVRCLLTNKTIT